VIDLDQVLAYAKRGWRVFPLWWIARGNPVCMCSSKKCTSPGKHPIAACAKRGCLDATTDEATIREWWRRYPDANVGIATGGRLAVIDIDPKSGGTDGFDELVAKHGRIPDTIECLTGGGGRHLYVEVPAGRTIANSASVLAPGVDVRGEGGYVVAPPSDHVSRGRYVWEASGDPADGVMPWVLSGAWLEALSPTTRTASTTRQMPVLTELVDVARNSTLFGTGRSMLAAHATEASIREALHAINRQQCVPPMDAGEVDQVVANVMRKEPGLSPEYQARKDAAAARKVTSTPVEEPSSVELPVIQLGTDEERINNEGIAALAHHREVYQRGGALVHVVCDESPLRGVTRPKTAPRIVPMQPATLREYLSSSADWLQPRKDEPPKKVSVPKNAVAAIHARGAWKGVRSLEAVIDCPVLRPDGTVVDARGYDARTGLLYAPTQDFSRVPSHSTRDDAKVACAKLADLFVDFPFRSEAHRAAAIAALLTPLATYAFSGPKPLFLFDANVAGAGKGKCVSIISEIVQGRPMAVMAPTDDDEEARKRIMAIALSGEPLTLIDNIEGRLGGAAMDAAITGQEVSDRILGSTAMVRMPLITTWFATGNNVQLKGDMQRRVVHVRLESPEAHPEDRKGFKHPNVERYAREHRNELVIAALTVLRAWRISGDTIDLKPWGSFAGWSDLVRGALVWCGYADPGETRVELREEADVTTTALAGLLSGWRAVAAKHGGYATVAQVLRVLEHDEREAGTTRALAHQGLREALSELCAGRSLTPRGVAETLRKHKGRVIRCSDGVSRHLHIDRKGNEGAVWCVRESDLRDASDSLSTYPTRGVGNLTNIKRENKGGSESLASLESLEATGQVIHVR
jgi:hypothetical protein